MADDRFYIPGDHYNIDDRTGFKVRASRTKKEWTGRIVREQSFEPRQPQDLVQGVPDIQTVPEPRPRQVNVFLVTGTTLTVQALPGAASIQVASIVGFIAGNSIQVALADGTFSTTVSGSPTGSTITLAGRLPGLAPAGGAVVNVSSVPAVNPGGYAQDLSA